MGYLEISGPDLELITTKLTEAYDVFSLKPLVDTHVQSVTNSIPWTSQGGLNAIAFEVIKKSNQHGLLDRLIKGMADDRPFRPDLRALPLYFSKYDGWEPQVEVHGMDLLGGLERLTSSGNPFVDTTMLANWLISTERQVCRVRCGKEYGTGFLIAPELVLTCYHVVRKNIDGDAQIEVCFDYRRTASGETPDDNQATWDIVDSDWTIPHSKFSSADINLQGEPSDDELDYAVLKLNSKKGLEVPMGEERPRRWVDLSEDVEFPEEESPILIVQHPGLDDPPPHQMPLKITFATPGFEGPIPNGTRLKYKPSTKPGSSGSPVFRSDFRAVALHHNRGQINPDAKDLVTNNRGIPLSLIRAALPPEVREMLTKPPSN